MIVAFAASESRGPPESQRGTSVDEGRNRGGRSYIKRTRQTTSDGALARNPLAKSGGVGAKLIGVIVAHKFERRIEMGKRRGFGSVKVAVTLGESRWQTSLFPNKDGSWFLPIKAPVRRAEEIAEGDDVEVELELL